MLIVACIVVNSSRPPKDGGICACEKGDYCGIELAKKCLDSAFKNKYIVARNYDETLTVRMITHGRDLEQNKTNSENRHLVFLIFKKIQENDEVGDISSLFQRHSQTNRLDYKQAVLYIYQVQSWQAVVSQLGKEH